MSNVATHLVTSGDPVRLAGMRPPGEGGSYALFAQYPDQAQWKDLNSFQFSTLNVSGVTTYTAEHLSVAGGASGSPNLTNNISYVSTTGSGTATGTLANGTTALDGFQKTIIAENITSGVPYVLTVTSLTDGTVTAASKSITFNRNGDTAYLTWSSTRGSWFATYDMPPDDLVVYVRTTGSDTNSGLSSSSALLTMARAAEVASEIGWNNSCTVNVDGTFTAPARLDSSFQARRGRGTDNVTITGGVTLRDTMTITAVTQIQARTWQQIITATGSASFVTGDFNGSLIKMTSGTNNGTELVIIDHQASGTTHTLRVAMFNSSFGSNLAVSDTFQVYDQSAIFNVTNPASAFNVGNSNYTMRYRHIRFAITATTATTTNIVGKAPVFIGSAYVVSAASSATITMNIGADRVTMGDQGVLNSSELGGLALCGRPAAPINIVGAMGDISMIATGGRFCSFRTLTTGRLRMQNCLWYNSSFYFDSMVDISNNAFLADSTSIPLTPNLPDSDPALGVVTVNMGVVSATAIVIEGNTATMPASWNGLLVLNGEVNIRERNTVAQCSANGILVTGNGQFHSRHSGSGAHLQLASNTAAGLAITDSGVVTIYDISLSGVRGTGNGTYGVSVKDGGRLLVNSPNAGTTVSGTSGAIDYGSVGTRTWASVTAGRSLDSMGETNIAGALSLGGTISPPTAAPASQAFGAVTANGVTGILTFTTSLAAATAASATITNSFVSTTTPITVQVCGYTGTYFTNGVPQVSVASQSSGSFVLTLINTHATNALTGTVKVSFTVYNT